jgi:hypothetical protein
MRSEAVIEQIEDRRIVAILRGDFGGRSVETVSIIFKINQSVPVVYSYAQHPEHCKP